MIIHPGQYRRESRAKTVFAEMVRWPIRTRETGSNVP